MPPLETIGRHQKAVVWPITGTDRYGEPKKGEPVNLDVTWEQGTQDVLKPNGQVVTLDGIVVVDRDIPIGSIMWLAPLKTSPALEQWYGVGSAGVDSGLLVVETVAVVEDLKGRHARRELGLAKFKDTLPES